MRGYSVIKMFFKNTKYIGFIAASIAAITYGLNPFFGIPLYQEGLTPFSVLFYRFSMATILMGIVAVLRKSSFSLPRECRIPAVFTGIMMALTCIFWFLAFKIMDSGISAALLFIYPIMVALIMAIFFKEKISSATLIGMIMAIAGAVIICLPDTGVKINLKGVIYILLSALTYAVYIVAVKTTKLRDMQPETLTFYAMLFSLPVFLIFLRGGFDLQMLPSLKAFINAACLAIFPSLLSFLMTAVAIRFIGATETAILGALEPVTAVTVGVCIFNEILTLKLASGTLIILTAVTIVICSSNKPQKTI